MLLIRPYGNVQDERKQEEQMKELDIEAKKENLSLVIDFVQKELERVECPMKAQLQVEMAVEEIFINIASYAYYPDTGPSLIRVEVNDSEESGSLYVILTFIDHGRPYDPLAKKDPDVTLPADQRQIGGLGIFMVKKSVDAISYEYKDGQNILTIRKDL